LIGQTLAERYFVRELIVSGKVWDSYLVWDSALSRMLTLKLLHEDFAERDYFRNAFARQVNILLPLKHPAIIRYEGFATDGRYAFLLLQHAEEITLETTIRAYHRVFPLQEVGKIAWQICSALHYLHQMGIYHCNLKPSNLLISENREVLLTDFGITPYLEREYWVGRMLGDPSYMSPQQLNDDIPDKYFDIYALGCVLFELLAGGQKPFDGSRSLIIGSLSEKIADEQIHLPPLSLRDFNPHVSAAVENTIFKCLEKDTNKRYDNAIEVFHELNQHLSNERSATVESLPTTVEGQALAIKPAQNRSTKPISIPESPRVGSKNKRIWISIGILLLLVLILVGGVFLSGVNKPASLTLPETSPIGLTASITTSPTIVPTATETIVPILAIIYRMRGDVFYQDSDGNDILAIVKEQISLSNLLQIKVQKNSAVELKVQDRSFISVGPESQVVIAGTGDPTAKSELQMELVKGRLLVNGESILITALNETAQVYLQRGTLGLIFTPEKKELVFKCFPDSECLVYVQEKMYQLPEGMTGGILNQRFFSGVFLPDSNWKELLTDWDFLKSISSTVTPAPIMATSNTPKPTLERERDLEGNANNGDNGGGDASP
jgi:serine/threonine-protein kinase